MRDPLRLDTLPPREIAKICLDKWRKDEKLRECLMYLSELHPEERYVYVSRIAYRQSFRDIGSDLHISQEQCIKIYNRAQQKIKDMREADDGKD